MPTAISPGNSKGRLDEDLLIKNGMFSKSYFQITGTVMDSKGVAHYMIKGHWDEQFTVAKIVSGTGKNIQTSTPEVLWEADSVQ